MPTPIVGSTIKDKDTGEEYHVTKVGSMVKYSGDAGEGEVRLDAFDANFELVHSGAGVKSLETITDELIDDAADTCSQDTGYLRSILRCYFGTMTEEEQRKAHKDAFEGSKDLDPAD